MTGLDARSTFTNHKNNKRNNHRASMSISLKSHASENMFIPNFQPYSTEKKIKTDQPSFSTMLQKKSFVLFFK